MLRRSKTAASQWMPLTLGNSSQFMQLVHTLADLQSALAPFHHPAVVPTMGNLHAGHLALVQQAKPLGDITVATIFVNRLQFGPHDDFDTYPRTLAADCDKLKTAGCDLVFAPSEKELFPQAQGFTVAPPDLLADILEGEFRPGFFKGVCTVVLKLLSCTHARTAVFGKKDYQQLMVIRQMVRQFNLPVNVLGGETLRSPEGLALSSRNSYLSPAEREQAPQLHAALTDLAQAVRNGNTNFTKLEEDAMQSLRRQGWLPDYVVARRQSDLQKPHAGDALVVLAAARLGTTRLIDNLEI